MNLSRYFSAIVALSAIFATATFAGSGAPMQKGPTQVIVTNSSADPVPTAPQGTTIVAGSVALDNGTTVGISGTPTVTVGNDGNSPVPVEVVGGASRVPFDAESAVGFLPGNNSDSNDFYTVPAGQRLVVESVIVHGQSYPGDPITYAALIRGAGEIRFSIPLREQGVVSGLLQTVGHVTGPFFFGPGTTVTFVAARGTTTNSANVHVAISGYLEEVGP